MFKEEAKWISGAISRIEMDSTADILDVGSSDLKFRTVTQPHIHEFIHKPLIERGLSISFLDIKEHAGVDIAVDLSSEGIPDSVFAKKYDLIICCNILEHVSQRDLFMRNMLQFTRPGSLLLVTVPLVYPKHNDPIDTMYRPTVNQLSEFVSTFSKCRVIGSRELTITDKTYYVLKPGRLLDYILIRAPRRLMRWYVKSMRWKVTCVLLEIQ